MNRDIKFRGKRTLNKEYVIGNLMIKREDSPVPETSETYTSCYIVPIDGLDYYEHEVDPSTISQFTGLKDKNGTEIYEGDIVKHRGYNGMKTSVVKFEAGAFIVGYHDGSSTKRRPMLLQDKVEVIGNIHDNSELLKQQQ